VGFTAQFVVTLANVGVDIDRPVLSQLAPVEARPSTLSTLSVALIVVFSTLGSIALISAAVVFRIRRHNDQAAPPREIPML
jgi:hypothetical protein